MLDTWPLAVSLVVTARYLQLTDGAHSSARDEFF